MMFSEYADTHIEFHLYAIIYGIDKHTLFLILHTSCPLFSSELFNSDQK